MAALDIVRAGGRGLDRRLDRVSGQALLAGLRAAGAVSEPEVAALGRPDSGGWARRLRALAAAKGDRTCRALLTVLEGLEGPPRPGPFDFYDPQRDSAPAHRWDCACCHPEEEEEGARGREEGPEEEEEEGEPKNEEENPEEEEGEPKNDDEGPEDDEGDEGPEDDEGGGDEGPEDDEGGGDEGPEDDEGDEGPEDDEGGGGDED
ncbi:zinc finger and BTB domain-containing protein 47-like isoform X5 [Haemorhous mexicanus]|uniref:zinc finger and BTB domain-containing protein 47-like isoform X5 n=1 Tax=Haemorhous mexicanus TaxID=30427 RepID=UPI0028BF4289|nr:zinc finger and BTB domain-containing protein 47-like isoform X5 [Haemorhous mexicanus]